MSAKPLLALALAGLFASAPVDAAKIVIIADSHAVGPFGKSLDETLAAKGNEVALYAVCGASAGWWIGPNRGRLAICYALHHYGGKHELKEGAPDPAPNTLENLLAWANPDTVVFALGSNGPAGTPASAEKMLAFEPKKAKCVWVGPPPMPSQLAAIGQLYNELPAAFSRANRPCQLIDSRNYLKSEQSTKDHFYGPPAVAWGKSVADLISP